MAHSIEHSMGALDRSACFWKRCTVASNVGLGRIITPRSVCIRRPTAHAPPLTVAALAARVSTPPLNGRARVPAPPLSADPAVAAGGADVARQYSAISRSRDSLLSSGLGLFSARSTSVCVDMSVDVCAGAGARVGMCVDTPAPTGSMAFAGASGILRDGSRCRLWDWTECGSPCYTYLGACRGRTPRVGGASVRAIGKGRLQALSAFAVGALGCL